MEISDCNLHRILYCVNYFEGTWIKVSSFAALYLFDTRVVSFRLFINLQIYTRLQISLEI